LIYSILTFLAQKFEDRRVGVTDDTKTRGVASVKLPSGRPPWPSLLADADPTNIVIYLPHLSYPTK
ncbi:unnamed protein product, partial [Cylicostephanus goldi]